MPNFANLSRIVLTWQIWSAYLLNISTEYRFTEYLLVYSLFSPNAEKYDQKNSEYGRFSPSGHHENYSRNYECSSKILNMTNESENKASVKPNGSTLHWYFALGTTNAVLWLSNSLIGMCQHALFKSSKVKHQLHSYLQGYLVIERVFGKRFRNSFTI